MSQVCDADTFKKLQSEIYRRIDETGRLVNPTVGCFHDGVAFPELYLASKKRVMWVLKNSYDDCDDDGNPVSDGMDVRDWFCDSALEIAGHKPIFIKMALASYCIQNGGAYSEDLLSEKVSVMRSLKEIALVDLSKLPGGTSISDKELKKEFSYFKEIVSAQIELYQPDIIIFGNTLHTCKELFPSLDYKNPLRVYNVNGNCVLRAFSAGSRLLLEAYHPSYSISYEDFVGTIASACKDI